MASQVKLVTRQQIIAGIDEEYVKMYWKGDHWEPYYTGEVYKALCALPPNPIREMVDAIFGSRLWTKLDCIGCGQDVEVAVRFGPPYDGSPETALICLYCLGQGLASASGGGE